MTNEELKNMLFIIDTLLDDAITDSTRQKVKDNLTEVCQLAIKALEQRWIPVSERLPESAGVYIVSRWFSDGCESMILTDACYFDGTCTWHNDNRINHSREYVDEKIVAWMPLPEPYKEDAV